MLAGYDFAEASTLATPYVGWMGINEGDPLYAPLQTKSPTTDTQFPVLSPGYPTITVNSATGTAVLSLQVNDTIKPEVVTARIDYGSDTNYGTFSTSSPGFSRTPTVSLPWILNQVYHYRLTLSDPAGNITTTGDYVYGSNIDTTPPSVSMTSPANGATVTGTVTLSATATDNVGVTGVQFKLGGSNLGSAVTGAGPAYSVSWDTTTATYGPHTLTAVAGDAAGNTATSSVSITVNNPVSPPVISAVSAGSISSSGGTVTWTTDKASDSQVAYGTTTGYGSASVLYPALVTSHSINLTGLAASTTYHYQVLSRDAQGNLASSGDFTFTTAAPPVGPQPLLQIHADASEVSGVTNGSIVTPGVAPAGFTGTVVVNGSGSVNFAPAQVGNGVFFQSCCSNYNTAYYKFTGAGVGSIFNVNQGQISFYLKSRYSFAQRQVSAPSKRYAFDVRDGNVGNHLFNFLTQVTSGYLQFNYTVAGSPQYYFVPKGTEDLLFGNGVPLKVALTWDGSVVNLYLNDTLVKSTPYIKPTPNWTAASNFDLGAYEYFSFGGYNVSDDVIDEFTVTGQ
jgi:hypothetical protein